jgi:hypothetical protein
VYDTSTVTPTPAGPTPGGTVTYEFFTTIDGTGSHVDQVVTLAANGSVPQSSNHGPLTAGSYSFIAVYSGDGNYTGSTSSVEPLTVQPQLAPVQTVIYNAATNTAIPSPFSAPLGTTVYDTATVTAPQGAPTPGGTVTYEFFTTIDGTGPHVDQVVTLAANGTIPNSSNHGPLKPGSYSFIAIYSGDNNYSGSTGAVEPLTINQGTSSTATAIFNAGTNTAIPSPFQVPAGTTVYDTTTLTTVPTPPPFTPSGTVTYEFFTTIDGTGPHVDQVVTLAANGSVPNSSNQGPLAAGSYSFIAIYSGDSNYGGSTGAVEPLTVNKVTPTITTQATPSSGVVNNVILNDTATLSGGFNPTKTITFTLTAPDGTTAYTDMITIGVDSWTDSSHTSLVTGNGVYSTATMGNNPGGAPATQIGTYTWHATYSGDPNNNTAQDNGANETANIVGLTQNGLTKGYYHNKNGEQDLTGSKNGTTLLPAVYSAIFDTGGVLANPAKPGYTVLVDGSGSYISAASFKQFSFLSTYLTNGSNGSNIANQMSVQLLTTVFNVYFNRVDPTIGVNLLAVGLSSGQLSALSGLTGYPTPTVQTLINAAIAELETANGTNPGNGSPDGIYEGALETVFDAINNNQPIFV